MIKKRNGFLREHIAYVKQFTCYANNKMAHESCNKKQ